MSHVFWINLALSMKQHNNLSTLVIEARDFRQNFNNTQCRT